MLYRFLDCELDEATRTLRRSGEPVHAEPKVLDLLVHLVRCRERLVDKKELHARIWPDTHVSDASLMQCIRRARTAIGDSGGDQRAIQTVRGRGYTFVAPVAVVADAGSQRADPASSPRVDSTEIFVGRESELADADEWLATVASGKGGLMLLPGEAGIGKSTLARRIADLARSRNFDVLSANGGSRLGCPPYWIWTQILDEFAGGSEPAALRDVLGPGGSDLARLAPAILRVLPDLAVDSPLDGEHQRARLLQAFVDWLRHAARRRPLLMVLDDLHLADRSSLMVFELLAREAARLPAGLVATYRSPDIGGSPDLALAVDHLRSAQLCREVVLEGWSPQQVGEIVSRRFADAGRPEAASLWQRTQGVPFFVVELLRTAKSVDELSSSSVAGAVVDSVPASIRALVRERLALLQPDSRRFLEVAALVGMEIEPEFVAAIAGLEEAAWLRAMEEAEESGILGAAPTYRFAHALYAEALYAEIPPFRRARWHAAVAEAYERNRREPAACAYHWLRANGCADAATVRRALVAAGDAAAAKHAYDDAVAFFEQALARLPAAGTENGAELRAHLLVKLASASRLAGRIAVAREIGYEAVRASLSVDDAELSAAAALHYSGLSYPRTVGRDPRAPSCLREVREHFGGVAPATDIRMLSRLAATSPSDDLSDGERLAMIETALQQSRELADRRAHAEVLLDAILTHFDVNSIEVLDTLAEELVAVGEELEDREVLARGTQALAVVSMQRGDLDGAQRYITQLEALAREVRLPEYIAAANHLRFYVVVHRGEFAEGERLFAKNARMAVRGSRVVFEFLFLARVTGTVSEISMEAFPQSEAAPELPWSLFRVGVDAHAGRRREARRGLAELIDDDFRALRGPQGPGTGLVILASLAQSCAIVGDSDAAKVLLGRIRPFHELWGVTPFGHVACGPMSRFVGQLATVLGEHDLATEQFERAVRQCEHARAAGELPTLYAEFAGALQRQKSAAARKRGQAMLRKAEKMAQPLGVRLNPLLLPPEAQR